MDIRKILTAADSRFADYDTAALLNVFVADYSAPVFNDRYALVKISRQQHPELRKFERGIRAGPDSDFVLAYNKAAAMPIGRFSAYLHNRFADSLKCRYGNIAAATVDLQTETWQTNHGGCCEVDDIPLAVLDDMFRLPDPQTPAADDFDIRLILASLHGDFLFRGRGMYLDSIVSHTANAAAEEWRVRQICDRFGRGPAEALILLHQGGRSTRLVDFTDDPTAALYFACRHCGDMKGPAEILMLPKSDLPLFDEAAYPPTMNCAVQAPPPEFQPRFAAQGTVPVFLADGCLEREQTAGRRVLIPGEAVELLLEQSGRTAAGMYPDALSFIGDPANLEMPANAGAIDSELFRETIADIDPDLLDFDRICFLDIEIRDSVETVWNENYMLTNIHEPVLADTLVDFFYDFTDGEIDGIKYVMGYNEAFDLAGFAEELRQLKPGIETNPVPADMPTAPKGDPARQRLRLLSDRPSIFMPVLLNIADQCGQAGSSSASALSSVM